MPTTHTVDCNAGEKIQDKIAIAKPGDTILVSGTASENVAVTRGSSARVVGNTIENNKGSGVFASRHSQADVMGSAISGNAGDGITATHNSGVNLDNEEKLFNLGANRTEPGAKNAGFGLSGAEGGYADGPLGTLDGAKGLRRVEAGCIDRVT